MPDFRAAVVPAQRARASLSWLVSRTGSLRERAIRGALWLLAAEGAASAGGLLKVAILGRVLLPADFGLMGMALLAVGWLSYFTEPGLRFALIQRTGDISGHLDTFFSLQVLRCAGLSVLLLVGAPIGAWFFANAQATGVIRAMAAVVVLRGFLNPALVLLRRDLDFRREFLWRSSGVVVGLVASVPLALWLRNAWALVLSLVVAQLTETILSYAVHPYRPRFCLDREKARELADFGKWIFLSNLLAFVGSNLDGLSVGRLSGVAALGIYQVAQQLGFKPLSQLGILVHGVLFPAFSRLENPQALKRGWTSGLTSVAAIGLPVGVMISVFAEVIVPVVLGPRWVTVIPVLRPLAVAGVASALGRLSSALLQASGRPDIALRASAYELGVLLVALYPLTVRLGPRGAALAMALAKVTSFVCQLVRTAQGVGASRVEVFGCFRLGLLASMPFLAALPVRSAGPHIPWPVLVTGSLAISAGILVLGLRSQLPRTPVTAIPKGGL